VYVYSVQAQRFALNPGHRWVLRFGRDPLVRFRVFLFLGTNRAIADLSLKGVLRMAADALTR
jgi:hypothetical protein